MENLLEPKVGDTRLKTYPKGHPGKQIYAACVDCGKCRWVNIVKGQPERIRCKVCGARHGFSDTHKAAILAGSRRRWAAPGAKEKASQRMSGNRNPFYGKKHPPELIDWIARQKELEIEVKPTQEWGYFIGITLGDGCVSRTNGGNYRISVASNRSEIVDKFYECVNSLGVHCGYEIGRIKPHINSFSNYKSEGVRYCAVLQSKRIYEFMRPLKLPDYHFVVPEIIYRHRDMLTGFLSGYFDAEGSVFKRKIECFSKHKDNLEQIKMGLEVLGINSHIYVRSDRFASSLVILRHNDRLIFKELIPLRIKRKQDKLEAMFS